MSRHSFIKLVSNAIDCVQRKQRPDEELDKIRNELNLFLRTDYAAATELLTVTNKEIQVGSVNLGVGNHQVYYLGPHGFYRKSSALSEVVGYGYLLIDEDRNGSIRYIDEISRAFRSEFQDESIEKLIYGKLEEIARRCIS